MTTLFGIDIAAELADAIPEEAATPATLISVTQGTRTAGAPSAGRNPTRTSYPCRGFMTDYEVDLVDGTKIQKNDREITLLAHSIDLGAVVPKTDDEITMKGRTYVVVRVGGDAADAVWVCQVRG